jgi:putative phosphoesterase
MKIALFSDIHANLPALEACLADIDQRKPDQIFCLGDLVGYNIWPNEVIQMIRDRGIPTIAGNYDYGIGRSSDDCGCAYKTEEEKANGAQSIAFTNQIVGPTERQYLRQLPKHIRLELEMQETENMQLLLVHGSPRKINEYLFEDRDEKSLLRILEGANADILCFGHTHKPYHRVLNSGTEDAPHYRHAINIGSVGKPKDGDPRGTYAMLEWDEHCSLQDPGSVRVQFIRFEYDVEKAAKAVENSPLPNAYATALRIAK